MRCFTHHDREAVGVCHACGKGLCADCAVDLGYAICCQGACEQEARATHEQILQSRALLQRNQTVIKEQKRNRFFMPAFFFVWGIVAGIAGLKQNDSLNFLTALGAVFIAFGLIRLLMQWRFDKAVDRTSHE